MPPAIFDDMVDLGIGRIRVDWWFQSGLKLGVLGLEILPLCKLLRLATVVSGSQVIRAVSATPFIRIRTWSFLFYHNVYIRNQPVVYRA